MYSFYTGETKVVGNKVFVFFDGNHRHLRAQIREGVAGVLINSMLYGANLQEIVSNAVLLNLPAWYTSGLTAYCGEEWTTEQDDRLRDLLQTGRYKTLPSTNLPGNTPVLQATLFGTISAPILGQERSATCFI